jgi:hypothetical protein|tara:strand:- start:2566 stop:3264 length:699 start_codon:yes stop_codon:yes gene_type:complete
MEECIPLLSVKKKKKMNIRLDSHKIAEIIKREKTLEASYVAITNECYSETCFTKEEKKILSKVISKLFNDLEFAKIKYWIDWGTFLGAYRDKSIIAWDKDFDIGIFSRDKDKLINLLKDSNDVSIEESREFFICLKIKEIGRDCLDINLWDKVETSSGAYIDNYNQLKREAAPFENLDSIYMEDLELDVPCPNLEWATRLLEGMYGESFMLPPGNPILDNRGKPWMMNKGGR